MRTMETDYVGLDLAWGTRNRSGLAVLDGSGRLSALGEALDDDAITSWVRAHAPGSCVVAMDAPLVVTNRHGRRACEAEISRVFGRFHAGAHPSNLSRPGFADGGRARALARRLQLDVDPYSPAPRRAVEVYPHPATITLFGLERVIAYKQKAGRPVADLRVALGGLMRHLESLPDLDLRAAAWTGLVEQLAGATRKAELKRVEDQVDAVLCAYVGLHLVRSPQDSAVVGDAASGYIVVPVDERVRGHVDGYLASTRRSPATKESP